MYISSLKFFLYFLRLLLSFCTFFLVVCEWESHTYNCIYWFNTPVTNLDFGYDTAKFYHWNESKVRKFEKKKKPNIGRQPATCNPTGSKKWWNNECEWEIVYRVLNFEPKKMNEKEPKRFDKAFQTGTDCKTCE